MVILRKKKYNIQSRKESKIFFNALKIFYNLETNFYLTRNEHFKNNRVKTKCFYEPLHAQTSEFKNKKYFFSPTVKFWSNDLKKHKKKENLIEKKCIALSKNHQEFLFLPCKTPQVLQGFTLIKKKYIISFAANISRNNIEKTPVFLNYCFDKGKLKNLITWFFNHCGEKATIKLVESLKDFGFHYATRSGSSIGLDDLKIPPIKPYLIFETESQLQSTQNHYQLGMVTAVERFQHMIDLWQRTSETLKHEVIDYFRSTDLLNPVYMMAFSGARGNVSQVRQLVGMRGLMADPQGQLIEYPIRSNFREGMTLTEYIISCYGARKGLVDTALRTATSGYLTRRLVDAAQHITISKFDCKTNRTILLSNLQEGTKTLLPLENRLVGRVLGETLNSQAVRNKQISTALALTLVKLKSQIMVRSPLTCKKTFSICQMCYGWSLAYGQLVPLGEAVGIIAAQSIGEPGTQLTMRTFHTGGVFSADLMDVLQSPYEGTVYFAHPLPGSMIRTASGKIAFFTKGQGELIVKKQSLTIEKDFTKSEIVNKNYVLPSNTLLFVKQGEYVSKNQILAEFSSVSPSTTTETAVEHKICSEMDGQVQLETSALIKKDINNGYKKASRIKMSKNLAFFWVLFGKLYNSGSLIAKNGDLVDSTTVFNVWNQTPNQLGEGFSILSKPFSSLELKKKRTVQRRSFLPGNVFSEKNNFLLNLPKKLYHSQEKQGVFFNQYSKQPQFQTFILKNKNYFSIRKERFLPTPNYEGIGERKLFFKTIKDIKYFSIGELWKFRKIQLETNKRKNFFFDFNSQEVQKYSFQNLVKVKQNFELKTKIISNKSNSKNWSFEKVYKTNKIQKKLSLNNKLAKSNLVNQNKIFLGEKTPVKVLTSNNCFNIQKQSSSFKKLQTTKFDFFNLKKFNNNSLHELVELAFQHRIFIFQIETVHYYKCGYVLKPFLPKTFFVTPKPEYLDLSRYQNQVPPFYSILTKIKQKEKKQIPFPPRIDKFLIGNSLSQNSSLTKHNFSRVQLFSTRLKAPISGRFSLQKLFVNLQFEHGSIFWIPEENYQTNKKYFLLGPNFLKLKNELLGKKKGSLNLGINIVNQNIFWEILKSNWATKNFPIGYNISRQGFKIPFFPKFEGWSYLAFGNKLLQQKKSKNFNIILKSFRKDFQFFIHYFKSNSKQNFFNSFEPTISILLFKSLIKKSTFDQRRSFKNKVFDKKNIDFLKNITIQQGKKLSFHVFSNPLIFYRYHYFKQQMQTTSILLPKLFTHPFKTVVRYIQNSKITSKLFFKAYYHLGPKSVFFNNRIHYGIVNNLLYSSSFLNFKNQQFLAETEALEKLPNFSEQEQTKSNFVSLPFKVQIKKGWIYFPKNLKQAAKAHQKFYQVDKLALDDLVFDQQNILLECLSFSTLKKNDNFDGIFNSEKSKFLFEKESFNKDKFYFDPFLQQEKLKLLQKSKSHKFSFLSSNLIFGSLKLKDTLFEFSKQIENSNLNYSKDFCNQTDKINFILNKLSTKPQQYYVSFNSGKLIKLNTFFSNFLQRIRALFAGRSDLFQILTNTNSRWYFQNTINETFEKNNYTREIRTVSSENTFVRYTLIKVLDEYKTFSFNWRKFTQTFLEDLKKIKLNNYKNFFLNKLFVFDSIIIFEPFFFSFLFHSNSVFSFASKTYKIFSQSLFSVFDLTYERDDESFYFFKKENVASNLQFLSNQNNFFPNKNKPKFFTIIRKSVEFPLVNTKIYGKTFLRHNPVQLNVKNENQVLNSLLYPKQKISFNDLQMYSNNDLQKPGWGVDFQFKPFLALNVQTFSKWFYTKQRRFFGFNLSFRVPLHFPFKNLQLHFALAQNSYSTKPYLVKKVQVKSRFDFLEKSTYQFTKIAKIEKNFAFPTASLLSFQINTKFFKKSPKTKYSRYIKIQTIFQNRSRIESVACESTPYEGEVLTTKKQGEDLLLTQVEHQSFFISKEKDHYQKELLFSSENVQIGNFFRSGEELSKNLALMASGQLIQIEKNKITLRKGQPFVHTSQGVLELKPGDVLSKNWPVMTFFYAKLKTEDIVQGIPKIEQLFEARPSPEVESLKLEFKIVYNQYKQQYQREHALLKSYEKIALIIVERIQRVYLSQGVVISDKHVEIIVKKVTSKVSFFDPETPVTKLFPEFISISTIIKKAQISNQNQTPIEFLDSNLIKLTARNKSKKSFQKKFNTINPLLGKKRYQKYYQKIILIPENKKIGETKINKSFSSLKKNKFIFPLIFSKTLTKTNTVVKYSFLDFKDKEKKMKQQNSIKKSFGNAINNTKKSEAFFSSISFNNSIFEDSKLLNRLNLSTFNFQRNLVSFTKKNQEAGTLVEFIQLLNFFTFVNKSNFYSKNNRLKLQVSNYSIPKNSTKLLVSLFPRAQNSSKTKNWSFQKNIEYLPCLVGITKETLNSDSFLAAASFQETIRVITRAVQSESTDFLLGIKERVILGERILAGTGDPSSLWLTSWLNYKFQRFVTEVGSLEPDSFTNLLVKSFLTDSPVKIKFKKASPALVKSPYLPLNTKLSQKFPKFKQLFLVENKFLKKSKVDKKEKIGIISNDSNTIIKQFSLKHFKVLEKRSEKLLWLDFLINNYEVEKIFDDKIFLIS